jgi:hypothetical protein
MPRAAYKPVYVADEEPSSTGGETVPEIEWRGAAFHPSPDRSSGFDAQPLHEGFGGIETRFFELGDQMSVSIDTPMTITWEGEQKGMRKLQAGWLLGVCAIVLGILLGVTAFVIHMMR